MAKTARSPTVYDVARLAGVSQATVSYVLNGRRTGKSRISEETRQRVLTAMDELGYFPNDTARMLRRRRTDRICLVLSRLGSPYLDLLAHDVQRVAGAHGYSIVIAVGGTPDQCRRVSDQLRRRLADGAIFDVPAIDGATLAPLVEANIPIVAVGDHLTPAGFDVVYRAEVETCHEAIAYLIARGHRRIAFFGHTDNVAHHERRYDVYLRALADSGIPCDERLVRSGAQDRPDAYHSAAALLALPDRPTAIFSASDIGAISAIWAARDAGLRVPEDVAIIGVGNVPEGQVLRPPLTTVGPASMDFSDIAQLLFSRLAGEAPAAGRLYHRPWSLIRRGSA